MRLQTLGRAPDHPRADVDGPHVVPTLGRRPGQGAHARADVQNGRADREAAPSSAACAKRPEQGWAHRS